MFTQCNAFSFLLLRGLYLFYLTGVYPVKFFEKDSEVDLTGVYPVKFFEKDSEVDLTGAQSLPR